MQLTKPKISFFAEDFSLIKQYLKADEIVEILSALQDLCIFGETNYQPKNSKQQYCWGKLKNEFDKDLTAYQAAVKNGKKGGRPSNNNPEQNPKHNPEQNPKHNPEQNPEGKLLDTCHLTTDSCHLSPDTSISAAAPKNPDGKKYAFEGKIIRLTSEDFAAWEEAYPDLNLRAELLQRDLWLQSQPPDVRKNWFLTTSQYFIRQNERRKVQNREFDEEQEDLESWLKRSVV